MLECGGMTREKEEEREKERGIGARARRTGELLASGLREATGKARGRKGEYARRAVEGLAGMGEGGERGAAVGQLLSRQAPASG